MYGLRQSPIGPICLQLEAVVESMLLESGEVGALQVRGRGSGRDFDIDKSPFIYITSHATYTNLPIESSLHSPDAKYLLRTPTFGTQVQRDRTEVSPGVRGKAGSSSFGTSL